jgi:hypothetical protein
MLHSSPYRASRKNHASANLTEYAMNLNMELGTLIRGGPLPGMVAERFLRLMEGGVLRRVKTGQL